MIHKEARLHVWGSPNHFQAPEISDCEPLDKPPPTPTLEGAIGDDG